MEDNFKEYPDVQFHFIDDETVLDDGEATILDDGEATILDDGEATILDDEPELGSKKISADFVSAKAAGAVDGQRLGVDGKTVFVQDTHINKGTFDQVDESLRGFETSHEHSSSWLFEQSENDRKPETSFNAQDKSASSRNEETLFSANSVQNKAIQFDMDDGVQKNNKSDELMDVKGNRIQQSETCIKKNTATQVDLQTTLLYSAEDEDSENKYQRGADSLSQSENIQATLDVTIEEISHSITDLETYSLKSDGLQDLKALFDSGLFTRYYKVRPKGLLTWAKAGNQKKTELLKQAALEISEPLFVRKNLISDRTLGKMFELDLLCIPELKSCNMAGLDAWFNELRNTLEAGNQLPVRLIFHGKRQNINDLLEETDRIIKKYPELKITRIINSMTEQPDLDQTLQQFPELGKVFAGKEYSSLNEAAQLMILLGSNQEVLLSKLYSELCTINRLEEWEEKIELQCESFQIIPSMTLRERFLIDGSKSFSSRLENVRKEEEEKLKQQIRGTDTPASRKELEDCVKLIEILYNTGIPEVTQALAKVQQEGTLPEVSAWFDKDIPADKSQWWMKRTKYDRLRSCLRATQNASIFYFFGPDEACQAISRMPYSFILFNILLGVQTLRKENPGKSIQNKTWMIPYIYSEERASAWKVAAKELAVCANCFGLRIGLSVNLCWQN